MSKEKELSFEEALANLEEIVKKLETGEVPLDDAISEFNKAMKLAKKMAVHMKEKLNCDGFNLLQNNEETAGQTVFHFHMHLIPRYKGDKNDDILKYTPLELSDDEMKEILDMIKVK